MSVLRSTLVAALLLAFGAAASAGSAVVRYVEPDRFADAERAGFGLVERERTFAALTRHFETLAGRHLPAGETLHVEVLDLDLAGELRMSAHAGGLRETRVLKGRADAPHLHFRYRLQRGDTVLAGGEARLSDLGYLRPAAYHGRDDAEPLPYERRMLERWFVERQ